HGAEQFPGGARMGTTFTGILVINDRVAVAHVGASRAILVRDGKVIPLTLDHSLVASLVRVGQMTEEEAAKSDERNVLVRCIDARVPMDESGFDGLVALGYEDGTLAVRAGDIVIITSDGVWGVVGESDFLDLIGKHTGAQQIANAIVRRALANGSDDNSTAMVVTWA
ncbi:MAG: serine/threonine-protein phosphatase, partial [Myxococcales bacterium]|nr:serine/threonine-protein phosphatase [Myxococcales bacterium]